MDEKQVFVAAIERSHGRRLRRFLAVRLRNAAADVPDLVQEVFLRLLRIGRLDTIRNAEAYLFTIASHVLHQHLLRRSSSLETGEILDVLAEVQAVEESDPAVQADTQQRLEELERVLSQLSPKAQAAFLLHRRDGFSLAEIGAQLGVSRPMAKKYLAKALLHCRQQLADAE